MRAMESIAAQDIPTITLTIDNGSTDKTQEWMQSRVPRIIFPENRGVSHGWNAGLNFWFNVSRPGFEPFKHVLVVNNDVVLPPWFYRQLLEYSLCDLPFVSGVSVDKMEQIAEQAPMGEVHPHPDFSAYLITRDVWEKVGPFNEQMVHYASDNDWHVRAHRVGVPLWKANVPFYHERSSTINQATPEERQQIEEQANRDRAVFQRNYGCMPWGAGYDELFK